jgi:hypothetical protein
MHRITRDILAIELAVAIRTAPKTTMELMRSKFAVQRDKGTDQFVEIHGETCERWAGIWGIDEPAPCPPHPEDV